MNVYKVCVKEDVLTQMDLTIAPVVWVSFLMLRKGYVLVYNTFITKLI